MTNCIDMFCLVYGVRRRWFPSTNISFACDDSPLFAHEASGPFLFTFSWGLKYTFFSFFFTFLLIQTKSFLSFKKDMNIERLDSKWAALCNRICLRVSRSFKRYLKVPLPSILNYEFERFWFLSLIMKRHKFLSVIF